MDIEGLHTFAEFEVINIVDDTKQYPALLGMDWAMGNKTIINFKRRILSFEDDEMRVVAPLDPLEGKRYVEPIFNEGQGGHLDNIYNVTVLNKYYINPTMDGNMSWRCMSSCKLDTGEALENWKNRLHEVSMR